jgi:hypothetical protein
MEYVAVVLGSIVFLLLQLNGVFNLENFSWKCFIKTNIISTILNLIIGMVAVFARADITSFYPITFFTAFILGIAGQAFLKKIVNMFTTNEPTAFGINK